MMRSTQVQTKKTASAAANQYKQQFRAEHPSPDKQVKMLNKVSSNIGSKAVNKQSQQQLADDLAALYRESRPLAEQIQRADARANQDPFAELCPFTVDQ